MTDKKATSFRLSPEAEQLLAGTAQRLGISKTAVLELAIRGYALAFLPPPPAPPPTGVALVDQLLAMQAALDQG